MVSVCLLCETQKRTIKMEQKLNPQQEHLVKLFISEQCKPDGNGDFLRKLLFHESTIINYAKVVDLCCDCFPHIAANLRYRIKQLNNHQEPSSKVSLAEATNILKRVVGQNNYTVAMMIMDSTSAISMRKLMTEIGQDYKTIGKDLSKRLLKDLIGCLVFNAVRMEEVEERNGMAMIKYTK